MQHCHLAGSYVILEISAVFSWKLAYKAPTNETLLFSPINKQPLCNIVFHVHLIPGYHLMILITSYILLPLIF